MFTKNHSKTLKVLLYWETNFLASAVNIEVLRKHSSLISKQNLAESLSKSEKNLNFAQFG